LQAGGRANGWVQPQSEPTLKIPEASRLSESPTGWQPVLRTTNFLSKTVLFGQYRYYFVAVRAAEREGTNENLGQIFNLGQTRFQPASCQIVNRGSN
jgi:hypothetical protein